MKHRFQRPLKTFYSILFRVSITQSENRTRQAFIENLLHPKMAKNQNFQAKKIKNMCKTEGVTCS